MNDNKKAEIRAQGMGKEGGDGCILVSWKPAAVWHVGAGQKYLRFVSMQQGKKEFKHKKEPEAPEPEAQAMCSCTNSCCLMQPYDTTSLQLTIQQIPCLGA